MQNERSNFPINLADNIVANKILEVFKKEFNIDLFNLQNIVFRRRIALAFNVLNVSQQEFVDDFKILSDEQVDQLVGILIPDNNELFRDTETWIVLRDKILNKFVSKEKVSIWFPNITSGEDIYSLIILLNEFFPTLKFQIKVTGPSLYALQIISTGGLMKPKSRTSLANYKIVTGKSDVSEYLKKKNYAICFNTNYLSAVEYKQYKKSDCFEDELFDIIMCRNKTLILTDEAALEFYHKILTRTEKNGIIVFGINEKVDKNLLKSFHAVSLSEKIYQK